jgi:hypothetical protein
VTPNIGIYKAMSAWVAVPPRIYREVLAFLAIHRMLEVRIVKPQVIHEAS